MFVGVGTICLIAIVFIFITRAQAVVIDGVSYDLDRGQTIDSLVQSGYANPKPGNLVSVDGAILAIGEGEAYAAKVNGETIFDHNQSFNDGDIIEFHRGADLVEPTEETNSITPFDIAQEGWGPLHIFKGEGIDQVVTTKKGLISGNTITEETSTLSNMVYYKYRPKTEGDKVVALTFDDGPWPEYTEQVLSVLEEHDVKATFFVVGQKIHDEGSDLVKKAHDSGHQIASHSYGHARGSGKSTNIGFMNPDEQLAEIQKGYAAIEGAIGVAPNKIVRMPGGNFDVPSQKILHHLINAEIGWSVDTQDWRQPGIETIVNELKSVKAGDVVLMHDGGGNRSQTVEALKEALPFLIEQGFRFVTIDELLQYPQG